MKTEEDKLKLRQFKIDIFNLNIPVSTTLKKYFKTINKMCEISTTNNISFFNFRADKINKMVQNSLEKPRAGAVKIGDFYYYKDLELICRKHLKSKTGKLYTNYSYK